MSLAEAHAPDSAMGNLDLPTGGALLDRTQDNKFRDVNAFLLACALACVISKKTDWFDGAKRFKHGFSCLGGRITLMLLKVSNN